MILVGQQVVHDPEVSLLGYSRIMRKDEEGDEERRSGLEI